MTEILNFQTFMVDGVETLDNPLDLTMDKDKMVEAAYTSGVVYVSVKVTNPTTTAKTITVKTTTNYIIPANGSADVPLKTGDELILPS